MFKVNWGEFDLLTKEQRKEEEQRVFSELDERINNANERIDEVSGRLGVVSDKLDTEFLRREEEEVVANDTVVEEEQTLQVPDVSDFEEVAEEEIVYTDGTVEEL